MEENQIFFLPVFTASIFDMRSLALSKKLVCHRPFFVVPYVSPCFLLHPFHT